MEIDEGIGRITWVPLAEQLGVHPVTVVVSDGLLGDTTQSFAITVDPLQQNQPPALLEHHVGGAQQGIVAHAVGDAAEGSHRTGEDDHRVEGIGAACEGDVHTFGGVQLYALGKAQAVGQFFLEHDLRVAAGDDVDLVRGGVKPVKQALGINRATGAGDGHKNSHGREHCFFGVNGASALFTIVNNLDMAAG